MSREVILMEGLASTHIVKCVTWGFGNFDIISFCGRHWNDWATNVLTVRLSYCKICDKQERKGYVRFSKLQRERFPHSATPEPTNLRVIVKIDEGDEDE